MTRFQLPEPAANGPCNQNVPPRRAPVVVRFPQTIARRRPALPAEDAKGEILLFLGVRYERLAS